jgi:hypothetical protein
MAGVRERPLQRCSIIGSGVSGCTEIPKATNLGRGEVATRPFASCGWLSAARPSYKKGSEERNDPQPRESSQARLPPEKSPSAAHEIVGRTTSLDLQGISWPMLTNGNTIDAAIVMNLCRSLNGVLETYKTSLSLIGKVCATNKEAGSLRSTT